MQSAFSGLTLLDYTLRPEDRFLWLLWVFNLYPERGANSVYYYLPGALLFFFGASSVETQHVFYRYSDLKHHCSDCHSMSLISSMIGVHDFLWHALC